MVSRVTWVFILSCAATCVTRNDALLQMPTRSVKRTPILGTFLPTCRRYHTTNAFRLHEQRDESSTKSEVKEITTDDEKLEEKSTLSATTTSSKSLQDEVPLDRRQEENDRAVMDRLLLPSRIGNAFTSALWFFVGVGFLLNVLGYAYIFDSDGDRNFSNFRIGTMDERRFREEIVRDMKQTRQDQQQQQAPLETTSSASTSNEN